MAREVKTSNSGLKIRDISSDICFLKRHLWVFELFLLEGLYQRGREKMQTWQVTLLRGFWRLRVRFGCVWDEQWMLQWSAEASQRCKRAWRWMESLVWRVQVFIGQGHGLSDKVSGEPRSWAWWQFLFKLFFFLMLDSSFPCASTFRVSASTCNENGRFGGWYEGRLDLGLFLESLFCFCEAWSLRWGQLFCFFKALGGSLNNCLKELAYSSNSITVNLLLLDQSKRYQIEIGQLPRCAKTNLPHQSLEERKALFAG